MLWATFLAILSQSHLVTLLETKLKTVHGISAEKRKGRSAKKS
jgi:hypothetical protein